MNGEEVQLLRDLNATTRKQLEISGLDFALEPSRYITRKLRTGEAVPSTAAYYQLVAPAATFAITTVNPVGSVWIGIHQSIHVSQNGVFEFTVMMDDNIFPSLHIPRLISYEIEWNRVLPFINIVKDSTTITYENHDIANQWISITSIGIYLRKDIWERDIKLMDEAAERYMHLAPPPLSS